MRLIKAGFEILTPIDGEEILKNIEKAARTCYQSEGKIEYEDKWILNDRGESTGVIRDYAVSARVLIKKLMKLGHEAMFEFGGMITVRFIVDRGVSHELVRHRVASFAQESTRYCNYGKDEHISFIIPCWTDFEEGIVEGTGQFDKPGRQWISVMEIAEFNYNLLIKDFKWSPQQARSVLPNSLKTEINVSANIREWRHILKLRTANAAHPQMQEVMRPLLKEFQSRIPLLFNDISYG